MVIEAESVMFPIQVKVMFFIWTDKRPFITDYTFLNMQRSAQPAWAITCGRISSLTLNASLRW